MELKRKSKIIAQGGTVKLRSSNYKKLQGQWYRLKKILIGIDNEKQQF